MSSEETSSEHSSMEEEEVVPQLAPEPTLSPAKRKLEQQLDDNEREKKRLRNDIKRMYIMKPELRKVVGKHAEIDQELLVYSEEQLKLILEECYMFMSGGEGHDPLSTGRALVNIIGNGLEKVTKLPGFSQRLSSDHHLVAMIHEVMPFDPQRFGRYVEVISSVLSHGVNLYQQWTAPPTMPHPYPPIPQPTSTSPIPPGSS